MARASFGDLIASADFPHHVEHLVWDPAGAWLAAVWSRRADQPGGFVVLDSATGRRLHSVLDVGAFPLGLAASSDGTEIAWTYVSTSPDPGIAGQIRVIDPRSGGIVWSAVPGGLHPAFSPNGDWVSVRRHFGSAPETAVYDARKGGAPRWAKPFGEKTVFSPDSTLLLTGGHQLASTETGEVVSTLTTSLPIDALAFLPDGASVAGFTWDGLVIERFEVSDGALVSTIGLQMPDGHFFDQATRRFTFSKDCRLLSVADAKMFAVFDTLTGLPCFTPHISLGTPRELSFGPDNSYAAVLSELLTILETRSGAVVFQQSLPTAGGVRFRPGVWFSPAGDGFAMTGMRENPLSGFVRIFGTGHRAAHLRSRRDLNGPVTAVQIAGAAKRAIAVSAGTKQTVTIFNSNTGELVRERPIPGIVSTLTLSPTADYFVVAGSDSVLRAFNLMGEAQWRATHNSVPVNAAAVSPRTANLIATGTGGGDKNVRLFTRHLTISEDPENHRPLWKSPQPSAVTRVSISADDRFVAIGCTDRQTRLLDAADGTVRKAFPHDGQIRQIVFSPSEPLLATANDDGSVHLIHAPTNTVRPEIGHPTAVVAVAFSRDGALLATATGQPDNTVRVWQLSGASPTLLIAPRVEPAAINAIAFSPTTSRLAIASDIPAVVIIDATTGQEDRRLPGTNARAIAYSAEGALLITAADKVAGVFDMV